MINTNNSDTLITCYYLLYKLKNNEILWIVKTSDDFYELKKPIKNFFSNIEKYYIVSKLISYSEFNLNVKQFNRFKPDSDCDIVYETDLE